MYNQSGKTFTSLFEIKLISGNINPEIFRQKKKNNAIKHLLSHLKKYGCMVVVLGITLSFLDIDFYGV